MRHPNEQASGHTSLLAQFRRRRAVEFSIGSMRLEGEIVSTWAEERLKSYVSGDRTISSIIREWKRAMTAQKAR